MRVALIFLLFVAGIFSTHTNAQVVEYSTGSFNFIENGGQWPEWVNYRADVPGGKIWLEKGGILYEFVEYPHNHGTDEANHKGEENLASYVYAEFVGSNKDAKTTHEYPTRGYFNYFLGNDQSKWATNLRGYNHINYVDIYDGVRLKFWENEGQLKYEFKVDGGVDPSVIQIKYHWAEDIRLKKDGSLTIRTPLGEIIEGKPYVYQIRNGKIVEIESSFAFDEKKNTLGFELGDYDKDLALVIDPVLIFATYSGSVTDNFGMTATYSYEGEAYSGGTVYGNAYPTPLATAYNTNANFPWPNDPTPGLSPSYGITDVFISKYTSDGTTMIWTNFIGGGDELGGTETVHSLICDKDNNVYLYGATSSTDFPIVDGFQPVFAGGGPTANFYYNGVYYQAGGTDIYVAKISADGTALLGSTYVGGSANDGVNYKVTSGSYSSAAAYDSLTANYGDQFRGEIMLDSVNNILISSCTRSTDFPTVSPFQASNAGQQDGVIFKVKNDFSALLFSSYLGGSQNDACYSVKIDSSYNIVTVGGTSSNDFPGTTGGLYPTYQGGKTDGFVTKITPDGTAITQSTYIGTPTYDQTIFVEIDRWDNVYIVGNSDGAMPVTAGVYSNPGSSQYIMKLNPALTTIDYATVFGSGSSDPDISPAAFLVDLCGNVYVSGWGESLLDPGLMTGMPLTVDAVDSSEPTSSDFYLFVLEADAASLLYATYLGGNSADEHVDGGTSRFDKYGVVYQSVCGGCGGFSDFPTSGASGTASPWSATNLSSNCNNIVFKFDFEIVPKAAFTLDTLEGCAPLTITITNESTESDSVSWDFGPGVTVLTPGLNPEILIDEPGTYDIILTIYDTICMLQDTAVNTINVYPALQLEIPNDTIVCGSPAPWEIVANTFGTASTVTWATDLSFTTPLNTPGVDSSITVTPSGNVTYYVQATNGWPLCDIIDSITVVFIDGAMDIMNDSTICLGTNAVLWATNTVPTVDLDFTWEPSEYVEPDTGPIVIADPPTSMWFYVTATTSTGCEITDSIYITVAGINPDSVYATADPAQVPKFGTTTLTAYPGGYTYYWDSPVTNPTAQQTTATVIDESTYEVTVTDGPCSYKTTVTVDILEFECEGKYIYVPNAFSPNNDGENDVMFVRGYNLVEMEFKIFDRWGELLFETTDQSKGWDGTFKGELVEPDVYVYHLKAVCADETEKLFKGNITVLR